MNDPRALSDEKILPWGERDAMSLKKLSRGKDGRCEKQNYRRGRSYASSGGPGRKSSQP